MNRDRIGFRRLIEVRMTELKEIFFDLETKRWSSEVKGGFSNIPAFGMSVAVSWDDGHGFRKWLETETIELVSELIRADKVIGFNIIGFDYEVLSAYVPSVQDYLGRKSLDIFADIENQLGFRQSLEKISLATLGKSKSGEAKDALEWFRQGQIDKVVEYCQKDVELTRDLYRFGQEHGFVCYPRLGQRIEIPVNWGAKPKQATTCPISSGKVPQPPKP